MQTDAIRLFLIDTGYALVDADFLDTGGDKLPWRLDTRTPYRHRAHTSLKVGGKNKRVYLERFVTEAPRNRFVRFRNSVTLDCRKANLEVIRVRSEVASPDYWRRQEWEMKEAGFFKINPQRRRTDAWRMWLEGEEPELIAKRLSSSTKIIKEDLLAMGEDLMAALR